MKIDKKKKKKGAKLSLQKQFSMEKKISRTAYNQHQIVWGHNFWLKTARLTDFEV